MRKGKVTFLQRNCRKQIAREYGEDKGEGRAEGSSKIPSKCHEKRFKFGYREYCGVRAVLLRAWMGRVSFFKFHPH